MPTRYLPLACFGKLPFWREYLNVGAPYPTTHALKEWLHQGKERLGLESGEHFVKDVEIQAQLRILLGTPGSKELLVGVLRPSRDAGGRHYPFAVFAHFPRRIYGKHYALLPLALTPAWEALDDAWEALAAGATKAAFEELLSSIEVPEPVGPAEARGDYRARQHEDAGRLFEGQDGTSMASLSENMPEVLQRLRKGEAVSVELPVARDLEEACFNASLWVDLVNSQFRLRRFEPSVFLDEGSGAQGRGVVLKFGALEPSDYLAVTRRGDEKDLLRPARSREARATKTTTGSEAVTYADLLGARF